MGQLPAARQLPSELWNQTRVTVTFWQKSCVIETFFFLVSQFQKNRNYRGTASLVKSVLFCHKLAAFCILSPCLYGRYMNGAQKMTWTPASSVSRSGIHGLKRWPCFFNGFKIVSLCELMSVQNTFPWPTFICALTCREQREADTVSDDGDWAGHYIWNSHIR